MFKKCLNHGIIIGVQSTISMPVWILHTVLMPILLWEANLSKQALLVINVEEMIYQNNCKYRLCPTMSRGGVDVENKLNLTYLIHRLGWEGESIKIKRITRLGRDYTSILGIWY